MTGPTEPHGDFEQTFGILQRRAWLQATLLIKQESTMLSLPTRDQNSVLRHGWRMPIDRRPLTVAGADEDLRREMSQIQAVLRRRVFELAGHIHLTEARLGALYALAHLLEPERVRDWEPLWHALARQDHEQIMHELLQCNWDRAVGTSAMDKRLFSKLSMRLIFDGALPA